jgi:CRP-like cAMP-binding protein
MVDLLEKIKNKYSHVPQDKLMEVISQGEIVMLDTGQIFVSEGERTHKGGLVLQGMMRNYIVNDNGEEVTVVFITEMQPVAAYSTVFLDKPATETSAAVEPSILFVLDFKEFRKKVETDPDYMHIYMQIIESVLVRTIERIEDFTKKKPEQRYQRLLETHGFLIERAPLKYLASYLGITPVSLSRIRKRVSQNRN